MAAPKAYATGNILKVEGGYLLRITIGPLPLDVVRKIGNLLERPVRHATAEAGCSFTKIEKHGNA